MIDNLAGLTAVISAMVVCSETTPSGTIEVNFVQYGALGLCGFMVWFLCNYIKEKERSHAEERKKTAFYLSKLAVLLGERPCLSEDREDLDPEKPVDGLNG